MERVPLRNCSGKLRWLAMARNGKLPTSLRSLKRWLNGRGDQPVRFSLHQLTSVFQIKDSEGLPYILIGGQAVNYWAERFSHVEPDLAPFQPFTSVDIDFLGSREDVSRIARQLGVRGEHVAHPLDITALSGVIPFRLDRVGVDIEILRTVLGLNRSKVQQSAIHARWNNFEIRVLDPISLLHAKAKLALLVSQKERRDVDHVKILVYCVRAFLREALELANRQPALVRGWLGAMEKSMALTESSTGKRLAKRFSVNWREILPLNEIRKCDLPKVVQFREKRLPTWEQKLARK